MIHLPAIYLSQITDLEQQPEWAARCRQWLAPEETIRLEGMRSSAQRSRFLLARALVRWLLADTLKLAPARVPLGITPRGKPFVQGPPAGCTQTAFSLSHSGQWVAVALAGGGRIGVDLEQPQRKRALMAMASRYFHPSEAERLATLVGDEQAKTFYQLWTQKEAYLKARGTGIGEGLDRVYFPDCGNVAHFTNPPPDADNLWHWWHWRNPIATRPDSFLSLAVETKTPVQPMLYQCLPGEVAPTLLRASPNTTPN